MTNQRGVTLVELLIAVAILALISSFAYPSYMRYVANSKRTSATTALLQIADRQQQFFMDNKTYANNLTALGYPANPLVIADDGTDTVATDARAVYSISLSNIAATTYTITAAPLHAQLERDTKCGNMIIDQTGARTAGSGSDDCW